MSEAPPLALRRTFALYAALFPCPFPISAITSGKHIAYHIYYTISILTMRSKWFPLRSRFCIPGGKTGDPTLAVTTFILRTDSLRTKKTAHLKIPERESFAQNCAGNSNYSRTVIFS
jgi:hypothetical protein